MSCRDCRHWQCPNPLRDQVVWADCYRVIAELCPDLTCCYMTNEYGTIERFFEVPFCPADVKYWQHNEIWRRLYAVLCDSIPLINAVSEEMEVRCITETRDDIVYDQKNGERIGRLKLRYFQTHKDFNCERCNEC